MKKNLLPLILCFLFLQEIQAQINVPVDLQTGKPIIKVPVYTVTSGDLALPISLNYTAGIPEAQENGSDDYNLGIGWGLYAGGSIERSVKSLPDDYKGVGTDMRVGWLNGNGPSIISGINIQSRTTCTDDAANYNALYSLTNNNTDTEPDVFNFNFGEYSGQFVFDNNKILRTIPYQDIDIQPLVVNGTIVLFNVTTPDGRKYVFSPTTIVTEKITSDGIYPGKLYFRK